MTNRYKIQNRDSKLRPLDTLQKGNDMSVVSPNCLKKGIFGIIKTAHFIYCTNAMHSGSWGFVSARIIRNIQMEHL